MIQRLSHFGLPDGLTLVQCHCSIRELHRFRRPPFHLSTHLTQARHLMVSLSYLKINTSRLPLLCRMGLTFTGWVKSLRAVDLDVTSELMVASALFRHIGIATLRIQLIRTCRSYDKKSLSRDDPTFRYGTHPIYLEHRYNATTGKASSSGVLLFRYMPDHLIYVIPLTVFQRRRFRHLPANAPKLRGIIDRVPYDRWYLRLLLLLRPN